MIDTEQAPAATTASSATNEGAATVSLERARDFVYETGTLFERALFAYLFESGDRERAVRTLGLYQNADGGWGNAVEHDLRAPASHPMATEYTLGLMLEFDLAEPETLARTAAWVERQLTEAGDLRVDPAVHAYPRAPWWQDVTSWPADAIVGRLAALGAATPVLQERTAQWAAGALTLEGLRALTEEDWRYRLYHYADYFLNVLRPGPDTTMWQAAIAAKVAELAEAQPDAECALGFGWAPRGLPEGAIPQGLIERRLDALASSQQEDGGWPDAHGLAHWRPIRTIWTLKTLRERRPGVIDSC